MLNGYKTYITAGLMVLIALANMVLGVTVPGFDVAPGVLLTNAAGLVFARQAVDRV